LRPRLRHSPCGSTSRPRPLSFVQGLTHAERAQRPAEVCRLPLTHSGCISAPWPPSSCARLPRSLLAELSAPGNDDFPLALPALAVFCLAAPAAVREPRLLLPIRSRPQTGRPAQVCKLPLTHSG
jgi:hypothetical protein